MLACGASVCMGLLAPLFLADVLYWLLVHWTEDSVAATVAHTALQASALIVAYEQYIWQAKPGLDKYVL